MRQVAFIFAVAVCSLFSSGCSSISLRTDILQGQPVNESEPLQSLFRAEASHDLRQGDISIDHPGLALISRQIDAVPVAFASTTSKERMKGAGSDETNLPGDSIPADLKPGPYVITLPAPIGVVHFYRTSAGYDFLVEDEPLPSSIVKSKVTRAMHSAAKAAANPRSTTEANKTSGGKVEDQQIGLGDVVSFLKAMFKTMNVHIFDQKTLNKITLQKKYHVISFDGLLFSYYESYFNGGFVDRAGQKFAKPKITNSIGDDVIDSFCLVFMEAFFDYEICGDQLSVPVLYKKKDAKKDDTEDNRQWLVGENKPTVAEYIPRVARLAMDKDEQMIELVRFVSGRAAEGGKKLAGMIARTFSHVHVSFVVGASFSFGGNDTLTKFIDTLAEEIAKRFTEAAMWNGLSGAVAEERDMSGARDANARVLTSERVTTLHSLLSAFEARRPQSVSHP